MPCSKNLMPNMTVSIKHILDRKHIRNRQKWHLVVTFVLSLATISSFGQNVVETWNHKIFVISGIEQFDDIPRNAYSTVVYDTEVGFVRPLLVKKFKEWTNEKVTNKKNVAARQVDLPSLGLDTVNLVATAVLIEETHNVKVSIAFMNNRDLVVNSDDHMEADKAARNILYELGVAFNQSVVSGQIATAKVDLTTLENKEQVLINRKESLAKALEGSKIKLAKLEEENELLTSMLSDEKAKAAALKAEVDAKTATPEELEKFDTATKEVSKAEAQLVKNEQSKMNASEKIEENGRSLNEKMKEVEEISLQLKSRKELIVRLESKYEAIK